MLRSCENIDEIMAHLDSLMGLPMEWRTKSSYEAECRHNTKKIALKPETIDDIDFKNVLDVPDLPYTD